MTKHLSAQEFVDLLDGQLAAERGAHLEACEGCRGQMTMLRVAMGDAEVGGDMPQPSPLFWDHFSARVRIATSEISPARKSWWVSGWMPIAGMAVIAIAVLLTGVVQRQAIAPTSENAAAVVSAAPGSGQAADEESLNFVAQLASTVPFEELRQAARPTSDATDALVAELTPQQRAELARLIKVDKGSAE